MPTLELRWSAGIDVKTPLLRLLHRGKYRLYSRTVQLSYSGPHRLVYKVFLSHNISLKTLSRTGYIDPGSSMIFPLLISGDTEGVENCLKSIRIVISLDVGTSPKHFMKSTIRPSDIVIYSYFLITNDLITCSSITDNPDWAGVADADDLKKIQNDLKIRFNKGCNDESAKGGTKKGKNVKSGTTRSGGGICFRCYSKPELEIEKVPYHVENTHKSSMKSEYKSGICSTCHVGGMKTSAEFASHAGHKISIENAVPDSFLHVSTSMSSFPHSFELSLHEALIEQGRDTPIMFSFGSTMFHQGQEFNSAINFHFHSSKIMDSPEMRYWMEYIAENLQIDKRFIYIWFTHVDEEMIMRDRKKSRKILDDFDYQLDHNESDEEGGQDHEDPPDDKVITGHRQEHVDVRPVVLDQGFRMTDERVWAGVLPQLLARLTHPIEGVRQAIVNALLKLGRIFPHATVFQLVVATRMKEIIEEDRFIDEPVTTRTFAPSQSDLIHYRCTSTLLDDMATYYPQLVEDTRVFVDELHHLNLVEEKWCFVLHQLDLDMMKRLSHIKKESEKTKAIERLTDEDKRLIITAKTDLIIGSVYRIVADLWRATQSKAEKGMEDAVRFVLTNREHVLRAIEESEDARRNGDEHGRWEAFGRLNVTLGRKASKKGGQLIDITHCIGRLVESGRQWRVPLPGQEDIPFKEIIYLTKVDTTCQVLSTKTRPKKMIMRGSDGIDRAFLLKTHEDLRLDERVMQMLRVSNLMMKKMGKRDSSQYTAKTYAVTPLGPLLGLIQWVNGAIPLYTFYRKWQMRENASVPQGKKASDGISLKPLELFEKKMKNLLAVNKLDPKLYSDRKSWHPELLKTLHDELCSETSKDLISREMWLRSNTAAHWSKLVKTFTRSTAVMSMLGAILGLGDRHPDNLLIVMSDFHIIHIDYNVCFDRGRKLRVPETVPFRLTQNIRNAFGVAGTEGLFSSSCASVLSSIRTHHSLFSLLLHPFVFDPLFDWSIRDSLGNSVSKSITHIVYGNDGRMEPKGVAASTLYAIKMKENEGILEKMSRKAMEYLDRLYCGGEGEMTTMVNDPLSKWIEMIDDLLWIIRKEEGKGEFLLEERREISKAKETMAWNGAASENGGITPVQTLIRLIPKIEEKLNAVNEECKSRNDGMKPVGLPPGLEDTVYKEETNDVASAIVGRVIKRAKGEVGGTDTPAISPQEHVRIGVKMDEKKANKSDRSVKSEQKSVTKSVTNTPNNTPDVKTDGSLDGIKKEDKRLSVDPEEGHFLETGGKQEFMLVNTTENPLAVKMKCSNNAQYRVLPVYLTIEKSQISTLSVTRLLGPAKNDKLVAAYCPMVDGVKDPKEAITKYEAKGKKCQIIRIMLKVVNAEDFAVPDPSREAVS